jgi:hypothetical protein
MRSNKTAIETAKAGKVTAAVVAVISVFVERNASCGAHILEMRSLLAKRGKAPIPWRKIPRNQESFLRKQEKVRF